MSLRDWKPFLAHEISEALKYRLSSVIVGWLFMVILLTIAAYLLWIWPYFGIFLIYWPLVLMSGLAIGIVGSIPVILLGKYLVWLWGDKDKSG